MNRMTRVVGLTVLILWTILGLIAPAAATRPMDLSGMSTEGIISQMEETFDGLNNRGRSGQSRWNQGFPDSNAFEYLLELDIRHVAANSETGFPEYYKITGKLFPEVGFELRLPPRRDWNKKFYMAGCGGFCGNNDTTFPDGQFTNNLNWGLLRGYAAATTDSGHSSWIDGVNRGRTYGAWAEDNRRGEIDWGYRSVHEVTRVCKALVHMFYRNPARYAYFAGCSTGGRQAIMEATRFPGDFDGVISGAPALEYTGLVATWMSWIAQAIGYDFDTNIAEITFNTDQIAAIQQAVMDQCDGVDGAIDGLIMDPRRCPRVNFAGLGLTTKQMDALAQIYSRPVNSLGATLYEGVMPYGSEIYWPIWVPGAAGTLDNPLALGLIGPFNGNFLKYMAFQEDDPGYSALDFNFDATPALLAFMGKIYNATSPQLQKFKQLGGKIIMYHGWADPIVPPGRTIAYFEAVVAQMGSLKKTHDFFRLFMVPGMDHCSTAQGLEPTNGTSIGLDDFDALTALENWVEKDMPPNEIMASGHTLNGDPITRPLFPYPLYPAYTGGEPADPDNFVAKNDGSVRWSRFRKDTFYAFEIPGLGDMPLVEGEDINYFQPYDHDIVLPGTYDWWVWSPSMVDGMEYDGYNGQLEKE